MANLAIKGRQARGDEVIEILKMLGGKNDSKYNGETEMFCYYIDENGRIECDTDDEIPIPCTIFTIEEFIEKFPYKVGDKVCIPNYESEIRISSMRWDGYNVQYEVVTNEVEWYSTTELNDFNNAKNSKEEIMRDKATLVEIDLTKELEVADEVEVILGDYEFVLKDGKTYFVKKKPEYPKTYEECCKVLWHVTIDEVRGYKDLLLNNLQMLLICRDAYWKISGDWKPEFRFGKKKYCVMTKDNKVISATVEETNRIIVFPTEEMRDAFYENFKELIEVCKELL